MEISAPVLRCGMGKAVCKSWDRMGTAGQAMGRETVGKGTGSGVVKTQDGDKTPYGGTVDGGNIHQKRERSGS